MSLVTGAAVSATAVAKSEVDLVSFQKEDFLAILRGNTKTVQSIQNLYVRRQEPSWETISANSVLYRMTNAQVVSFPKKIFLSVPLNRHQNKTKIVENPFSVIVKT
jgi:CRP-like cAMP-binding protein